MWNFGKIQAFILHKLYSKKQKVNLSEVVLVRYEVIINICNHWYYCCCRNLVAMEPTRCQVLFKKLDAIWKLIWRFNFISWPQFHNVGAVSLTESGVNLFLLQTWFYLSNITRELKDIVCLSTIKIVMFTIKILVLGIHFRLKSHYYLSNILYEHDMVFLGLSVGVEGPYKTPPSKHIT